MEYKQVILIRTDIEMSCGKKCVQVAHASTMVCDKSNPQTVEKWKQEGMRKIVLKVPSLVVLQNIASYAQDYGIISHEVVDFGLTQVEPNTVTALGFEPLEVTSNKGINLDGITKALKLL